MAYAPHVRLTWGGTLPGSEIWSNTLSVMPDDGWITDRGNAENVAEDAFDAVKAYHQRDDSGICDDAVLKFFKVAVIDANGHYAVAPFEFATTTPGKSVTPPFPNQIARRVTLHTAGDLGRVKGGFYQPLPSPEGYDLTTQLWSTAWVTAVAGSVEALFDDLRSAWGVGEDSFEPVVASQGRKNKNGTVRLGPLNHPVTGVTVGRRADVVRRRANEISEARLAQLLSS